MGLPWSSLESNSHSTIGLPKRAIEYDSGCMVCWQAAAPTTQEVDRFLRPLSDRLGHVPIQGPNLGADLVLESFQLMDRCSWIAPINRGDRATQRRDKRPAARHLRAQPLHRLSSSDDLDGEHLGRGRLAISNFQAKPVSADWQNDQRYGPCASRDGRIAEQPAVLQHVIIHIKGTSP